MPTSRPDSSAETLPTLDLRRYGCSPTERSVFLADLLAAARGLGFFYVTGHDIPADLVRKTREVSRAFFDLPDADKRAIAMVNSPHFRGYNGAGLELTRGRPDWREQIDVGAEEEVHVLGADAPPWARLRGPNQWPAALPQLKPVLLAYQAQATALAIRILRALAAALDQPEGVFEPIYSPAPNQLLKVIRYPGRSDGDRQGVGAHKDSGFVSVLLQDERSGLEIEAEAGWIKAPPVEGTFVVNIGEILELASNGYLRANVHRVVSPPEGADRLSIAFFLGARLDATVPVLNLPPAVAAEARGLTQDPLNPLFHEVGRNYLKSRLRSHPDVAQRHHPDLVDPAPERCCGAGEPALSQVA